MTRRSVEYHERIIAHLKKGHIEKARRETEEHILVNKEKAAALYAEK